MYLQFDECYNGRPPKIFFHTILFHPNGEIVMLLGLWGQNDFLYVMFWIALEVTVFPK